MVESSYMNDTSIYAQKLGDEKAALEAELSTVARKNPTTPGDWEPSAPADAEADPNLEADRLTAYGEHVAIAEDLEARYKDVLDALSRIEAGTYGICEVGGEAIEADRLEANPAARTCMSHIEG